ncbi:MAG: hypothetical protein MR014_06010, partial [Oscillospiraceae bacterium]|nr:hypothetical protein [Oscillospiraceae bacterium]
MFCYGAGGISEEEPPPELSELPSELPELSELWELSEDLSELPEPSELWELSEELSELSGSVGGATSPP